MLYTRLCWAVRAVLTVAAIVCAQTVTPTLVTPATMTGIQPFTHSAGGCEGRVRSSDSVGNDARVVAGFVRAYTRSVWPDVIVGVGIAAPSADAAREGWRASHHGARSSTAPRPPTRSSQACGVLA